MDAEGECWLWTASLDRDGHGQFNVGSKRKRAHRFIHEALVEPLDSSQVVDHLCRVRRCVNPAHLEPVPNAVNIARGALAAVNRMRGVDQTHCRRGGHELAGDNLIVNVNGRRECRQCRRGRARERRARERPDHPTVGLAA